MPEALSRSFGSEAVRVGLGLLLAGGVAGAAFAQTPTPGRQVVYGDGARAPAILAAPTTAATPGMVDESALRYYAAQKQTARMKAEIGRLKRLYPGWTEPEDLDTLKPSPPEEAPLWDLFTAGRFDDLREAIANRRASDPAWQPSEELTRKLLRAEFRSRITALGTAQGAKRAEDVVALYRADQAAVDPSDVESIWTIADSLAAMGSTEEAQTLYRSVLQGNADAGARRATIQKAMAYLKMAQAEELIALGRGEADRKGDGKAEFDPIRLDITRAQIAAFLHDDPAQEPKVPDLAAFQAYAKASNDPGQTSLLGWYGYKRRQYRDALDWFKLAIAHGGDAMVAHGLAHTLRALNRVRDAEEVAYAWRDRFVGNEILYIDLLERRLTQANPPFVEPARIERYAKVVAASGSGEGAQALGWYAYNSCQFEAALEWFQRGVAWLPGETTVLGYALTLQRLKRQREYLEVINRYDGLFPKVVDLLFREDVGGPPLPCQATPQPAARQAAAAPPAAEPSYGRVPKPGTSAPGAAGLPPAIQRKEFPLAVALDNPLRFPAPSAQRLVTENPPGTYAPEPVMPAPPLVARRVPGAGAMPYERYGFALLPGYNGSDKPSGMPLPAAGTLWRQQEAERTAVPGRSVSEDDRFSAPGRASALDATGADTRRGLP
ncbi:tetratricopeptide repeat protein [Methylobacterium sp. Leaf100]|uniref:tetratricopeptide repeat protein n=1 Tax=Methylobacterium sp. Leaf100 TaxID=1736252 RepID=UPI0006F30AE5|nr:tetratricopeptide repeat protein [Methylobacterium sp. Leaf100]KQP24091.1 hypothetical protein ASF25_08210 [Methylobacterium sp. Leaf100]